MRPKLYQVVPNKDFSVVLYYDNGEIKTYDCKWILKEQGVFTKIHKIENFMDLCVVMNNTLAFDISGKFDPTYCIDICPDTVYNESLPVADVFIA